MHIIELAEIIGGRLVVTKEERDSYYARFAMSELRDGTILISAIGIGKTPGGAVRNYIQKIRGQRLIIHSTNGIARKEFNIPKSLLYKPLPRRKELPFLDICRE